MKENSPRISKKVILLAVAMMLWPVVFLFFNMLTIYSLVGTSSTDGPTAIDEQTLSMRLSVAMVLNKTALYLGPVSFIGSIALLIMKSKR